MNTTTPEPSPFKTRTPNIAENLLLRIPQREAYAELIKFALEESNDREVGIVLPVGCGKSGEITLSPFAFKSQRVLVVAPGTRIAKQLHKDFDPAHPDMFYGKCEVLDGSPYPEPVEIRGTTSNRGDLDEAHVVITNIQQIQGEENRWLLSLPEDYFDLILVDEAHHNVAASWEALKKKFPHAKIVNFSATPLRADGQLMAGRIIYSYPVHKAINEGYVKRLKAIALNPTTLKYVRHGEGGKEIEVGLDEVRELGERDAGFRRSIVTSVETLNTIVDASINELQRLRSESGDNRLKIIASALNFDHCRQIVEAYRARSLRADYVHSKEDGAANDRVMEKLENHEIDIIVQVRKLGEGFDHPCLAVAAVFSVFSNLSPFVQFVGRIMRAIVPNDPKNVLNRGTVVFHAGANVARRWEDFQQFSGADREYFDQLLPMETLTFNSSGEVTLEPVVRDMSDTIEVRDQAQVLTEEIPLLRGDLELLRAFEVMKSKGVTPEEYRRAIEVKPVPTTKVRERQAKRTGLDMRVKTAARQILANRGVNPMGRELDTKHLGNENLVILKKAIDRAIKEVVGGKARSECTRADLDKVDSMFDELVEQATNQVFDAKA